MMLHGNVKIVMSYEDRCKVVANLWRNIFEIRSLDEGDRIVFENDCTTWEVSKIDVLQMV